MKNMITNFRKCKYMFKIKNLCDAVLRINDFRLYLLLMHRRRGGMLGVRKGNRIEIVT